MATLVLPPSEFSGEAGTAVGGRVVLRRDTTVRQRDTSSGGKGKKKGHGRATNEETPKCEVHLLGGQGMPEILYVEAWAEAAAELRRLAVIGRLLQIQNPKLVPQRPRYSISRLPYFLRVVGPVGVRTLVEQMVDAREVWNSIPQRHPYTNLAD